MDNSLWQNLTEVFIKLTDAYESAIALGKRKHAALVNIDMKELSRILDEEQLLISKIQRLENRRGKILSQMAQSDPRVTPETRMEEFIASAPTRAIEEQLRTLHRQLSANVEETIRLRDNNQILAQGALDAVNFHLNRIGGATVDQTYSNKGGTGVTYRKNFNFKA